jgi:hypothetical protein
VEGQAQVVLFAVMTVAARADLTFFKPWAQLKNDNDLPNLCFSHSQQMI